MADSAMVHCGQQARESLRFQQIVGELIRQEALLDKLFATVPEAIVVLDTDDGILRVNPIPRSRKQEEERIREENVRLEERTRIAQELHDTLLQTLQSASMHLGAAVLRVAQDSPVKNQLDRILEIMRQGIVEGRNAIQGLRSSGSQTSDLVGALSRIQDELKVQPDIDFRVTVTGCQKQLAREVQHEIYRIGREALVNAFCHSGAKRIELELEYSDSNLYVRICDNGCGIDPQMLERGRDGHWGLAGMRERATRIGGLFKIASSPAAGTEIQLSIPPRSSQPR